MRSYVALRICRDGSLKQLRTTAILRDFTSIANNLAENHRQLFTTYNRGYLGCGSFDIEMDDVVILIARLPAPMVRRDIQAAVSILIRFQNNIS